MNGYLPSAINVLVLGIVPSHCPTKEVWPPTEATTSKSDADKTKETSHVAGNSGVSEGLGDIGHNEEQPAQIISDADGDRVQGNTSHSRVMQSQPEEVEGGKAARKQSISANGLRADAPNTDPVVEENSRIYSSK